MADRGDISDNPRRAWITSLRTFSCLFWGLALTLLLASGVLRIRALEALRLPGYLPGLLILTTGALLGWRMPSLSKGWTRRARSLLLCCVFEVYLVPFVTWWRGMPFEWVFVLNMVIIYFVTLWLLMIVNALAVEAAAAGQARVLFYEARICQMLVVAVGAGLLLAVAWRTAHAMALHSSGFAAVLLHSALLGWPRWIEAITALPVVLTMAVLWEAKELSLSQLRTER